MDTSRRQQRFEEVKPRLLKIFEAAVLKAAETCPEGFRSWLGMSDASQPEQSKEQVECLEPKEQS